MKTKIQHRTERLKEMEDLSRSKSWIEMIMSYTIPLLFIAVIFLGAAYTEEIQAGIKWLVKITEGFGHAH